MIPLRDSIPASRTPVVRNLLVAICAAVWLLQLTLDPDGLIAQFGMVPARVTGDLPPSAHGLLAHGLPSRATPLPAAAVPEWLTLLTCTFLHGGWLHFAGNMLFLWIFGDNVEDRFGRVPFLLFYLGCGIAASVAHLLAQPASPVPTVGASGAIAGVMGAYLFLYPQSRVEMLWIFGFFVDVIVLPAPFFLGYWFVLQLVQGAVDHGGGAGVAWWAHIGGFALGAAVAGLLRLTERLRPAPTSIVLQRRRIARSPWRG